MLVSVGIETPPATCVLLVDDDPLFCRLLELYLRGHGYRVLKAHSGSHATHLAGEADVALVDMVMPELDGLGTIPLLREQNRDLKLIAWSGSSEAAFRQRLDQLEVERFLPKPFSIERLVSWIESEVARN